MQFDDFEVNDDELHERLSSWRRIAGKAGQLPASMGDISINEAEVRMRQRRIANMCLNTVWVHDAFVADLKDHIGNGNRDRDVHHQQRVEDESAFALGVFEQTSALALQKGIEHELNNLPTEVIQTVTVPAPPPPRSWLQRALGI
jgi:hypothetical protein